MENKNAPINNTLQTVLQAYGLTDAILKTVGTGLIHHTWQVVTADGSYILQRINTAVFPQPQAIAQNIRLIGDYLQENFPGYLFVQPLQSISGKDIVMTADDSCFRLAPFVQASHTINVVETASQAYEAARQFGRFTHLLSGFNAGRLKTTIPHFHDLDLRYQQFETALKNGNRQRITDAKSSIAEVIRQKNILKQYKGLIQNQQVRLRVTHHDTKISNVLFGDDDKGLCVIDLDTVMPGYFISDTGDMMRTYLSPVSEEENDFSKIEIREDFYKAIVEGYADEMKDELTATERAQFFFAGQFMIYMQAMRFLTDHLNDDNYYGAAYEGHNWVRAKNQLALLENFTEKRQHLESCVVR